MEITAQAESSNTEGQDNEMVKALSGQPVVKDSAYVSNEYIMNAVKAGNVMEVKRLVESDYGINVNEKVSNDGTLLHLAAQFRYPDIVKYLVQHGANVNINNDRNEAPLHSAVKFGSLDIIKYLLENGAQITADEEHNEETILFWACHLGKDLIVDYLLQRGAAKDIDKRDHTGRSPLAVACFEGHTAVVRTLLKFNADIRKEKELRCGNDEIINILKKELKKSIKHREKIQLLRKISDKELTKVVPPLKYFTATSPFLVAHGYKDTRIYIGIMEDDSEVAVKRLTHKTCKECAENERNIMSLIHSKKARFIVNYRHFFEDDTFLYLICDLCEETLDDHVHSQAIEHLRKHGPRMINEILTGVYFLHNQGILHRDLKPSNILIDVEGRMRLSDFGISLMSNVDETTVLPDVKGTPGWMPAEFMEAINLGCKGRYQKKSDIQSTGMIAFFILTKGKHPFGSSLTDCEENIMNDSPVNLEQLDDLIAQQFVQNLIHHNIYDRPSAEEALAHPFLDSIPQAPSHGPKISNLHEDLTKSEVYLPEVETEW